MCEDIAPREMESYLEMLNRAIALEDEVHIALVKGQGNIAEIEDLHEFLYERRLNLEAMAGEMNDTYILVTPYAELLRAHL